ncbi:MAG: efflux RND transporter periplasmic adaptor subunit [Candidatus Limiplasma sp.]|nr:efflux RND transporter periplasmic adaptor subunit [Candidatus Limiplasma sp.]
MKSRIALKGLLIFFALMALLTMISRAGESLLIANVEATLAMRGALSHEAVAEGIIEAADVQMVWAQSGLRVSKVYVQSGARVKPGDVLVEFDMQSIADMVSDAQLELDQYGNERAQLALEEPDSNEDKEIKAHALKLKAADLNIEQARNKVTKLLLLRSNGAQLYCPMEAVVSEVNIQAGKETGSDALLSLATVDSGFVLRCKITREEAVFVAAGDTADVTLPGKWEPRRVKVDSILDTGDKEQVEVILQIPKEGFALSMLCTIRFRQTTDSYRCVVPVSALRSDSAGDYVLVLREKKSVLGNTLVAERTSVSVQDQDGKRAAVSGALVDGDQVITGWDKAVESGSRVRQVMP